MTFQYVLVLVSSTIYVCTTYVILSGCPLMYVSDGHVYMACLYNYVCNVSDDTVYILDYYVCHTCILCMPYLLVYTLVYICSTCISLHDCILVGRPGDLFT